MTLSTTRKSKLVLRKSNQHTKFNSNHDSNSSAKSRNLRISHFEEQSFSLPPENYILIAKIARSFQRFKRKFKTNCQF